VGGRETEVNTSEMEREIKRRREVESVIYTNEVS